MVDPGASGVENGTKLRGLLDRIGEDSILALSLFPEILQLIPIEGYKQPILQLMVGMADSNRLPAAAYERYFTGLFPDAQILLKKQQLSDEKNDDDEEEYIVPSRASIVWDGSWQQMNSRPLAFGSRGFIPRLDKYAELLAPFYERPGVARWFSQLMQVKSLSVKHAAALILIRNNRPVPDSVLHALAADDWHRARLYDYLVQAGKANLFPAEFRDQASMARRYCLPVEGREAESIGR